jgi:DNA repair protein RecN (Recombination protein N)
MLLSLKIKNYALIDYLYVEFHKGLNIITGETGAGKSILLGALGLILGKRANTTVLSNTEKKCVVEAEFNLKGYKLERLFEESDVDFDVHTVFRREILANGKSRAFINDTPVNLGILQDIALQLVDIHSQHQNLLLNQQSFLLNIIDRFNNHDEILRKYLEAFNLFKSLKQSYSRKLAEYNSVQSDIDYLTHQVNELAEAKIVSGEIVELENDLALLDNAGDIKNALNEAAVYLSNEERGVLDSLKAIADKLNKIIPVYAKASELFERVESARIELKEVDADLNAAFENLEFDPKKHEQTKNRLNTIYNLMQKYRVANETELIDKFDQLSSKLSVGVDGEYELEKLKAELQKAEKEAVILAQELSTSRKKSFNTIEQKVLEVLSKLGMLHGQLKIESTEQEMHPNGMDEVSFLFSANKNHPLQDVSKIASGGELSRLMLSIKAISSRTIGMPTIILDEIDTGVSGEIADKVGDIICLMSKGMQVINITHLPQVASKGEAHFLVYKDHKSESTQTLIKKLNETERLHEIAKMLSGKELSEAAVENAKELLKK